MQVQLAVAAAVIAALAVPVLAHRLLPMVRAEQVLADLVNVVPLPKQRRP